MLLRKSLALLACPWLIGCIAVPAFADQELTQTAPADVLTYADLVGLAQDAPLVVHVQIRDQALVEPERSPGLAPGHARLYVEGRTLALIAGSAPLGESLRYLVDVPLDADGDAPKFKKQEVILFARPVPGRPGELQLVKPNAQLAYDTALEARLRPILVALRAADKPPVVTGIRDALSVEGTLAGESETQIFLDTQNDGPVSLTIARRPNMAPRWGVSWTEIVDQSALPPQKNSLEWYRLACTLPPVLPASASLSSDAQARDRAAEDYAYVLAQLGPCERTRG